MKTNKIEEAKELNPIAININEIVIKDLNDLVITVTALDKTLSNDIYKRSRTIEMHAIATLLNKGNTANVLAEELEEIIAICNSLDYDLWIKLQIVKYFTDKLNNWKNG